MLLFYVQALFAVASTGNKDLGLASQNVLGRLVSSRRRQLAVVEKTRTPHRRTAWWPQEGEYGDVAQLIYDYHPLQYLGPTVVAANVLSWGITEVIGDYEKRGCGQSGCDEVPRFLATANSTLIHASRHATFAFSLLTLIKLKCRSTTTTQGNTCSPWNGMRMLARAYLFLYSFSYFTDFYSTVFMKGEDVEDDQRKIHNALIRVFSFFQKKLLPTVFPFVQQVTTSHLIYVPSFFVLARWLARDVMKLGEAEFVSIQRNLTALFWPVFSALALVLGIGGSEEMMLYSIALSYLFIVQNFSNVCSHFLNYILISAYLKLFDLFGAVLGWLQTNFLK